MAWGRVSHSEGDITVTYSDFYHTEGICTVTYNESKQAERTFNISYEGNSPTVVQDMRNGDAYIKGIGGFDGTNYKEAQSLQDFIGEIIVKIDFCKMNNYYFCNYYYGK